MYEQGPSVTVACQVVRQISRSLALIDIIPVMDYLLHDYEYNTGFASGGLGS